MMMPLVVMSMMAWMVQPKMVAGKERSGRMQVLQLDLPQAPDPGRARARALGQQKDQEPGLPLVTSLDTLSCGMSLMLQGQDVRRTFLLHDVMKHAITIARSIKNKTQGSAGSKTCCEA
jgi:hypothetical protein